MSTPNQTSKSEEPVPPKDGNFDQFTNRYFTDWRAKDDKNAPHQYVYQHSNNLFVVGVAKTHPLLADKSKTISKIIWDSAVSDITVSGKRKRGSVEAKPQTPLCVVELSDGEKFTLCAGICGQIVEVNARLVAEPNLLSECPGQEGFLCIILVKLPAMPKVLKTLVSADGKIDGADVAEKMRGQNKRPAPKDRPDGEEGGSPKSPKRESKGEFLAGLTKNA